MFIGTNVLETFMNWLLEHLYINKGECKIKKVVGMELILLGLLLCGWLGGDNKNSSKKNCNKAAECRNRERRKRERYWEDAHWWSLNR